MLLLSYTSEEMFRPKIPACAAEINNNAPFQIPMPQLPYSTGALPDDHHLVPEKVTKP